MTQTSNANPMPTRALRFVGTAAELAAQHGLKKGLARAAAKTNPWLLAAEATVQVCLAIQSYSTLKERRAERDMLSRIIPAEAERLAAERERLAGEMDCLVREAEAGEAVRQRLRALVAICADQVAAIWADLLIIRGADLPSTEEFEARVDDLTDAWANLTRALGNLHQERRGV